MFFSVTIILGVLLIVLLGIFTTKIFINDEPGIPKGKANCLMEGGRDHFDNPLQRLVTVKFVLKKIRSGEDAVTVYTIYGIKLGEKIFDCDDPSLWETFYEYY